MRWVCLISFTILAGCGMADGAASAKEYRDPSGFSLNLPDGWKATRYERGEVKAASADQSQFTYVIPIIARTRDCATILKLNLESGWGAFPGASEVVVEPAGRGSAVARFRFMQGAGRGALLCAETGPRTGMMYGMGAPAARFAAAQPVMAAVLKSFKYGAPDAKNAAAAKASAPAMPRMTPFREPNEGAWVIQIPEGWRPQGGIVRISNTDVRGGIRLWSPDGAQMIQFNDTRLDKCLVPGPQSMTSVSPGNGVRWCPYQTGLQVADWYVQQMLARDLNLNSLEITNRQDRPDLSEPQNREMAAAGLGSFQHSHGQVSFRATRQGQPVEGVLQGMTRMLWSPDRNLMGGNYTMDVKGFVGPVGSAPALARIGGHIESTWQYNVQWIVANRQASARDANMVMNYLRASGEAQQKSFWDRMAASDRRAEAVGDLMLGRVRLSDGQGNQYEAKAGSNYYFYDEQAGRTASRPNDAVVGTDVYPSPTVDLRPLEVIR